MRGTEARVHTLVVDDHDVVREGLALVLGGFDCIGELTQASDGFEALELLKASPERFGLLVTDLQMPKMGGLELIRRVRQLSPYLPIIALTVDAQAATVAEALHAGAGAYMLKNSGKQVLYKAIEQVLAGKTFVDAVLSGEVIHYIQNNPKSNEAGLSPRELEVLKYIGEGLTTAEIAEKLFLAVRTVETHRKNIHTKTGVKGVAALVLMAKEKGWI